MKLTTIHPDGWSPAKGYANGVLVEGATRTLHVAGQVAWDAEQRIVGPGDFAAQFRQAVHQVTAGRADEHQIRGDVPFP